MKTTIMEEFRKTADRFPNKAAMKSKVNGRWVETTWQEYYRQVRTTARTFMALGLVKGKSVSILGNNCPQWFISNLAAIFAGGIPAGIYTTNSPEQCQYIAEHSEANIIVVENDDQLAKILKVRNRLPDLKAIVLMNGSDMVEQVYEWKDLATLAQSVPEGDLDIRIKAQHPDDCCELIYTSGTTGNPKGVMLSHDNILWTVRQAIAVVGVDQNEQLISYLPLSHIVEQVISFYGSLLTGATSWFAESLEKLKENLVEVRPTLFTSVPRVWEKIQEAMMAAGSQNRPMKKKILTWARKKGLAGAYAQQDGAPMPFLYGLAEKLVFSMVKQQLGLDRCWYFGAGAAPTSVETLEFFGALGIRIAESYGMSETTGPTTMAVSEYGKYGFGTVGLPLPGAEVSIADDGEILIRGPHVFKGYLKNEAATREAIDKDNWFHSGDVGEIDKRGFLKITDRKKELIITAGGENIAPQVLESKLKSIPEISQAVVIGDRRKYISALITLNPERIKELIHLAGSAAKTMVEASECKQCREFLQKRIDEVNATFARVQTIKKFFILPAEMTIESGELTPTMKLKRRVVYEKYAGEIESMYR